MHKNIIKNFFIFSFGALLMRGVNVIIAPIIMRKVSPTEYGALSLIQSFIAILTPLTGFGLRQALSLEYFHHKELRKQKINDIITIYVSLAIPLFALLLHIRPLIEKYIFLNQVPVNLITLGIFITFIYFFSDLFSQVMQYEQHAFKLTIIQICITLITVFTTLFLLYTNHGIASILIAQTIGMSMSMIIWLYIYATKKLHKQLQPKKHLKLIPHYFKYGLPFIPGMLFAWLLTASDRWLLARFANLHDVGIYAIAAMFGYIFNMLVILPWQGSYLPHILNSYAQNKNNIFAIEKQNKQVMYAVMAIGIVVITLGYFLGKSVLFFILPPNYHAAIAYIWLILMGNIFFLGAQFVTSFIQFQKKSLFLGFVICIPATLNIVLNYLLIPQYGINGCVGATLISYIAYFLLTAYYNSHLIRQLAKSLALSDINHHNHPL